MWKNTILRQKITFFPIAEGGAENFGVFRVKNHDFTPKKSFFFPILGGGGRGPGAPPLDPPLLTNKYMTANFPGLAQALQSKVAGLN